MTMAKHYDTTSWVATCQGAARALKKGKKKVQRSAGGSNLAGYCKARRNGKPSKLILRSTTTGKQTV